MRKKIARKRRERKTKEKPGWTGRIEEVRENEMRKNEEREKRKW